MSLDAARLTAVISPLRRALLSAATARESLPDIPDAQIEVLRALLRGGSRSPSDLADELGLGRSTVSNLLAAMERADLVQREAREDDRRRVLISPSPRAADLFGRFDAASSAIVADAAAGLAPGQRGALEAALPALEQLRDLLVERSHDARTPRSGTEEAA